MNEAHEKRAGDEGVNECGEPFILCVLQLCPGFHSDMGLNNLGS
jgi:hypothetical protein